MADSPDVDAIAKKEPDVPAQDPIVSRSTSGIMLVCALLLIGSLAWALWDEAYGMRPWRGMQKEFVARYTRYLKNIRKDAKQTETDVKASEDYQTLDAEAKAAQAAIESDKQDLDKQIAVVQNQLDAVTEPFQDQRGRITVLNYDVETASSDSKKNSLRKEVEQKKQETIKVKMPAADGSGKTNAVDYKFPDLEKKYNELKDQKAELLSKKAELLKKPSELAKKRDEYLKNHVTGLTDTAIAGLIRKNETFDYSIAAHQISVPNANIVDRCEACHLGAREPLNIKASDLAPGGVGKKPDELARAFVSHPNKELLQIHNPDRFGCSSCHGGNGRATTTIEKAHGRNPFWLHPLYEKENTQAGCQQCHTNDRVLQGADTLNLGKDLFYQRGCVGCHRYEGFDRDADALSNTRQTISQLEDQIAANERQGKQDLAASANVPDTEEGTAENHRLIAHEESLRVTNSQLAARKDQLNLSSRYLLMDQKKVGPNLKDVRLKLRKEWIPVWLENPQAFRPGTKMPTFWRFGDAGTVTSKDADAAEQIKAISAYLWQNGFEGQVPQQQGGNADHGKELFETRGCLACHSIGEGDEKMGGTFAANLQRVGEKASFDYIVRWIYNPRERWMPYCPKEKRDLTREDYEKTGKPYVFDKDHSTCPNDGAELQVQNMTVMPNFRLPISDARDIASYLFKLAGQSSYPDASFMDQSDYAEKGKTLIKQYGCAGCHEIKGFEEEQRIGKELTAEGATPIERLDFALLTRDAEEGHDPLKLHPTKKGESHGEEWYNHRGFFDHKLADPSVYDKGKEKAPQDRLRMPRPYLTDEWRTALTTFLLGSVGQEGATVPTSLFYNPSDRGRDIQEGWWVIKKYNCMGCHNVQVGQNSVLSSLPVYQGQQEALPPKLTSEGARVDPDWLLGFLRDPSLSDQKGGPEAGRSDKTVGQPATAPNASPYRGGNGEQQNANANQSGATGGANQNGANQNGASQNSAGPNGAGKNGGGNNQATANLRPQPGMDRNGVRPYLKVRMPTFNFSPNELRTLVRFFMAVSSQQEPYIKENLDPLTEQERTVARTIFTSGTPCLKCHITGEPSRDKNASAPNFLLASERLKPEWTHRWLLDPQQISPGTAMPSELFIKEGERWVAKMTQPPPVVSDYHNDHVDLLVRYMFLMTPDEQRRLMAASPVPTSGQPPASQEVPPPATTGGSQKVGRNAGPQGHGRGKTLAKLRIDGPMARAPDARLAIVHRPGNYSP